MNQHDEVSVAFDIIVDEIGSAIRELNNDGAQAFQNGIYDAADKLSKAGKELASFQAKLYELKKEWINTFDAATRSRIQSDRLGEWLTKPFAPPSEEPSGQVSLTQEKYNLLKEQIRESRLGLSKREYEALKLVQSGKTNEEIAIALGTSGGTVRNYLSNVYFKLKVRNRTEAVKKAIEVGLLDPVSSF